MKNIYFCGSWLNDLAVGVNRYQFCMLKSLDRLLDEKNDGVRISVVIPRNMRYTSPFRNIRLCRAGYASSAYGIIPTLSLRIWNRLIFPLYILTHRGVGMDCGLNLQLFGVKAYAIHDCIQEKFYKKSSAFYLYRYIRRVKVIAKSRKKQVITVSEHSKADIMELYGIPSSRITVIPNGWEHMTDISPDESILERHALKKKGFCFALGSRLEHKNTQWVAKTAKRNPDETFVITGLKYRDNGETDGLPDNVMYLGHVSDGEMKALMQNCKVLLQPSFYEGFGIPPIEALSVGTPVIAANASCLPEIYGDTVHYIDPYGDGCNIGEILKEKTGDPRKVLEKYNWKHSAEIMYELMLRLL